MATGTRWIVGLALAVMVLSSVAAGPASVGTAGAPLPYVGQLPDGPETPAAPPPTSPTVEIADTSEGYPAAVVAYNSQFDEYLVVWEDASVIWGRRVTSRGQLLGPPFQIATGGTWGSANPSVAYDSSRNRYLVVWGLLDVSYSKVYGRFVPAMGPSAALTAFAIDPSQLPTHAAFSVAYALAQDEFLVVWSKKTGGAFREATFARRIEADGSGFPASSFLLTEHATDNRWHSDVAYNLVRNEYLVTVDDWIKANENVYGTRLTAGGHLLGGEFGIAGWPDDEAGPSVAACPDGDQYLVTWHSIRVSDHTDAIYGCFVSGDGSPGDVVQIKSRSSYEARSADAACGVTKTIRQAPRYLVAWAEDTEHPAACRARQVYLLGTMDAESVYLGGECEDVVVAGGAMNYLAVFVSGTKILARIVGNTRPQAHFTVTPQEGNSTTDFLFDASGSSDVTDPTWLEVRWDWQNDGVYDAGWTTTRTASHRFPLENWQSQAVFTVQLQVRDVRGATDESTGQVKVYNAPPSALLAVQPSSGNTGTTFQFDASGSSDPEGGTLQVRWDWQDDGTYDTAWGTDWQPDRTFGTTGTYTVRVQVRDNWEQADSQSRQVAVGQGTNAPPTAAFSVTPSSGDTATLFAFDASGSTDAEDGAPSEFRWDWQDDGTFDIAWSASTAASHTFPTAGTYSVRLEVRDSGLLTGNTTSTVLVAQPGALQQTYLPLVTRRFP